VLGGGPAPPGEGTISQNISRLIVKYREYRALAKVIRLVAAAMRPLATNSVATCFSVKYFTGCFDSNISIKIMFQ